MGNFYDNTLALGGMYDFVDINGEANYTQSFLLDESIYNESGWFLEFQLNSNFDFSPASLQLFSAMLREEATTVSAPGTFPLMLLSAAGLIAMRQRKTKGE